MTLDDILKNKKTLSEKILAIFDFYEDNINGHETLGIHPVYYNKITAKILKIINDDFSAKKLTDKKK